MTEHTKWCLERQAAYEAFVAKWPGFCRSCYAHGYHHSAATFWEPEDFWECGCLTNGKCPRCGKEIDFFQETYKDEKYAYDISLCQHCGWTDRYLIDDSLAPADMFCPEPECYCDMEGV